MSLSRIRLASLHDKVISAEQAAQFIENGMTVGMSGFTRAGEAKAVPQALVELAKKNPLKITLIRQTTHGSRRFISSYAISGRQYFTSCD